MSATLLAMLLLPALAAPPQLSGPVALDDVYYAAGDAASDAHFDEHVLDVIFPKGSGPASAGYPHESLPVVVYLRGGNENKPLAEPANPNSEEAVAFLAAGFVYVEPSYAVVDMLAGEPHELATQDCARAVQFVRAQAAEWNLDPSRLFLFGHSGGALVAYDVGLRWDFQDRSSPDPVARESSRPDAVIAWGGITDFTCFFPQAPALPWFFGVDSWTKVTEAQKVAASPVTWLNDPAAWGRDSTPCFALFYNLDWVSPCGAVINPHDGRFGLLMQDALRHFDRLQGPQGQIAENLILVDIYPLTPQAVADKAAAWATGLGAPLTGQAMK